RNLFVERLTDTLVDTTSKKATGVVVGIAGEWGSGKSSILNLVEENIRARYSDAIIFSFNPWLISDAKDLIAEFLDDFLVLVRQNVKDKEWIEEFEKRLNDYADIIATVGDAKFPGLGKVVKYLQKRFLNRTKTARQARTELIVALKQVTNPIIIMIDELD